MDKKDYDLKLWSYVQSDSTFFNLSIDEVGGLLKSNLSIDEGIKVLKEFKDPEKPEEEKGQKQDGKKSSAISKAIVCVKALKELFILSAIEGGKNSNVSNKIK